MRFFYIPLGQGSGRDFFVMRRKRKSINSMRDCVKHALLTGSERGCEFQKMRHSIVVELKRLGYSVSEIKNKLIEWNHRCEKRLGPSEQKIQLLGYVDWVFKRECRISCKALEDYCLGADKCQFHIKTTSSNRKKTSKLPFNLSKARKFIESRFKANGYVMNLVLEALIWHQHQKATGETILIGYRSICSIIRDRYGHNLYPMDIFRKVKLLEEEGIIEVVVKGKRGQFTNKANGYKFCKWRPP